MLTQQLFTVVTAVPVQMPNGEPEPKAGTNNESERAVRSAADARKTCRTSKTIPSADLQTILVSVLESFCQQLTTFALTSVSDEILQCFDAVLKLLRDAMAKLQVTHSGKSILDLVFPDCSG